MKHQSTLRWFILWIGILALIVAGAGLFWSAGGQPFEFHTLRGETVMISGQGLYYYDTVNAAAQAKGQDVVTLVLALPLLVISARLAFQGSLRGQLLLTGTIGYFLYTYAMMVFSAAFNGLFLAYVALFTLSLYAFILSMMSFNVNDLPQYFNPSLPRRGIAIELFTAAGFLFLAWLGRIVPPLLKNQPPVGIESTTTLVIQGLDLGIIVPLAFLSAILLLRRSPWGYLLASVALLKFVTYGTAVSAMALSMILAGVVISPVEVVVFPTLTLVNLIMAILLLQNIQIRQATLLLA